MELPPFLFLLSVGIFVILIYSKSSSPTTAGSTSTANLARLDAQSPDGVGATSTSVEDLQCAAYRETRDFCVLAAFRETDDGKPVEVSESAVWEVEDWPGGEGDAGKNVASKIVGTGEDMTVTPFLYFHHIRKAGGTWFCDWSMSNVRGTWRAPERGGGERCFLPSQRSALLYPHSNADLLRIATSTRARIVAAEWESWQDRRWALANAGVIFGTMLRDPIERIWSLYVYEHVEGRDGFIRANPDKPLMPPEKWVRRTEAENFQVRVLSGMYFLPDSPKELVPTGRGATEADYLKARAVLERFHFVLTLEDVQDGITYMRSLLGWERNATRSVINKSGTKEHAMPPGLREQLEEKNEWDMKLFAYARQLFRERVRCDGTATMSAAELCRRQRAAASAGGQHGDSVAVHYERRGEGVRVAAAVEQANELGDHDDDDSNDLAGPPPSPPLPLVTVFFIALNSFALIWLIVRVKRMEQRTVVATLSDKNV
jgi:hypothetical protein